MRLFTQADLRTRATAVTGAGEVTPLSPDISPKMDACILRQRKDDESGSETDEFATQVAETAKSIVKTCRNTVSSTASIVSHESLPEWMKDNDFIVHGHRQPMPSFRHCFRTIFHVHTETGNIWTHLFGFALVSLITAFSFCQSRFGR